MRQLKISQKITSRESKSCERYLQEVGKIPLIAPEDEVVLSRRIKTGDAVALDMLVKANLRFVVSVAKQYQYQGLSLQDLINEGNLGLIKAAQRFDETKGFKFISYAVWWIRQSIIEALAQYARIVRLPQNKLNRLKKAHTAIDTFVIEHEREPVPEDIARILEISIVEANRMMLLPTEVHTSLDAPISSDEESITFGELLTDNEHPVQAKTDSQHIRKMLLCVINEKLRGQQREVLIAYYGLDGKDPLSIDHIGERIGLTSARIRQIKDRAIMRLKTKEIYELLMT